MRLASVNVQARCANLRDHEDEVQDVICVCSVFRLTLIVHNYKFVTKAIVDSHISNQTETGNIENQREFSHSHN